MSAFSRIQIFSRASVPSERLIFNQKPAMELLRFDRVCNLYIVHTHTNFQGATVLQGKSAPDKRTYSWNAGLRRVPSFPKLSNFTKILELSLHPLVTLPLGPRYSFSFLWPSVTKLTCTGWRIPRFIASDVPSSTFLLQAHRPEDFPPQFCQGT